MHRCWHPSPSGRPKFSDLHKLFDYYLTKHTQEKYPYIDMETNTPYSFDQLTPKSLSDYRAHMKEVLTIEDLDKETSTSQPPIVYADNRLTESRSTDCNTTSDCSKSLDEVEGREMGTRQQQAVHVGVHRLANTQQFTQLYDQLRDIELPSYDTETLQDTLNSIYMMDQDDQEYRDELWYKKLSTITEASNEDYQM